MSQPNPLKPLLQRLISTPVNELPSLACFLASSISRSFSSSQATKSDSAILLHKLKTRISSLLQDRLPEGRFTAVVIIKALIEVGGRDILADSEPWIRGLIAILNKEDAISVKKLAIVTITRAFLLSQEYPSIVREVTTPLIPAFNTACLSAIRPKPVKSDQGIEVLLSPLLHTVLQCWTELLPQHPSTFRPFVTRFRPICLSLLSHATTPVGVCDEAAALLVALHHSAPKNSGTSEWLQLCQDIISSAHATADQIFRGVYEEWKTSEPDLSHASKKSNYREEPRSDGQDKLGLTGWVGIHQGTRRLSMLLKLVDVAISSETAKDVSIPVGRLLDLSARLLSLVLPTGGQQAPQASRANPEIGKEERELLFSEIPTIHVHTLGVLVKLFEIFQEALLPVSLTVYDQLFWLFSAEKAFAHVRCASYSLLNTMLPISGGTATEADVKQMSAIIRQSCRDLLPMAKDGQISLNGNTKSTSKGAQTTNVDSFAEKSKISPHKTASETNHGMKMVASNLLSTFLTHVQAQVIPPSLRTEVDRTAILIQHESTILASVLNPATSHGGQRAPSSILPFLAQGGGSLHTEALLRPRMPVIEVGRSYEMEDSDVRSPDPTSQDLNGGDHLEQAEDSIEFAPPKHLTGNLLEKSIESDIEVDNLEQVSKPVTSLSNKRFYSAIDGPASNEVATIGAASSTQPSIEIMKKPRLEQDQSAEVLFSEQGNPNVLEPNPEIRLEANVATGFTVHSSASFPPKAKITADTSDDSDSDIPEINADLDTDAEEEDSDEYEVMEHE